MAAVDIVVTTHNRPELLNECLRSIQTQHFEDWQCWVIGDGCSESTAAVVDALADKRFRYYNNPLRFGEQSGCTNIGIAVSDAPIIALMNQDDLWHPDHLKNAVSALDQQTDWVIQSALIARPGHHQPYIRSYSKRQKSHGFWRYPIHIEPASAWVLRRTVIEQIGFWQSAREIFRPPIQDFFLRACRAGIRIRFTSDITVLKLQQSSGYADQPVNFLRDWRAELSNDAVQSRIQHMPEMAPYDIDYTWQKKIIQTLLFNPLLFHFFRPTGIDMYSLMQRLRGRKKGDLLTVLLTKRTGEEMLPKTEMESAIALAREYFDKRPDSQLDRGVSMSVE